jgi:glycosyltransferase involved in cell wall biosynthesis
LKILFVVPRFHSNQAEWIRLLKAAGHEVAILAQYRGGVENYSELEPVMIRPGAISKLRLRIIERSAANDELKFNLRKKIFFPSLTGLWRRMTIIGPELVICRDRSRLTAATHLLCRLRRIPCVLYDQAPLCRLPDRSFIKRWLDRLLFPQVRMTPVSGKGSSDRTGDKVFYVPFAVAVHDDGRRRPGGRQIRLLTIGKFYTRKNHGMLVEVFSRLQEEFDVRLTLIGESNNATTEAVLQDLRRRIRDRNLEGRVTIKVNVPHDRIGMEYREHDVFVLPSTQELASVSHIEAMGYGLPAIVSDCNGTAGYVSDGITGFLFRDMDAEDLYGKLRSLCRRPEQIRDLSENALAHVRRQYSGEAVSRNFEMLFRHVLAR